MESATTKNRVRKHSEETKRKISKANTGKKFSEERKKNIGKSREKTISLEEMNKLQELWSKHFVPSSEIKSELNLSDRVYRRLLKNECKFEQAKFLDQSVASYVYEAIVEYCKAGMPYKDIAQELAFGEKWIRHAILVLSKFYPISPLPRSRPVRSLEQRKERRKWLISYNKENPKKKENNPNWKGGISKLSDIVRRTYKYRKWREQVITRDNFECIICSSKNILHVDHIYPFNLLLKDGNIESLEEAKQYAPLWNVKNGRTLCRTCHRKTETYGKQRTI